MRLHFLTIEVELPPRLKRWGLRLGIPGLALAAAAAAFAAPLHVWSTGDTLQASDLNGNFQNLQEQVTALASKGGTVTSVTAGTGLKGGPITSSGTIEVDSAVVATLAGDHAFSGSKTFNGQVIVRREGPDGLTTGGASSNSIGLRIHNAHPGGRNWTLFSSGGGPSPVGSFGLYDDSGGGTRLVVDSDGRFGIGTTSPESALHVRSDGSYVATLTKPAADGNAWLKIANDARSYLVGVRGDASDAFVVYDNAANANRLVVDTTGSVGINTAGPTARLDVVGSTQPVLDVASVGGPGDNTNPIFRVFGDVPKGTPILAAYRSGFVGVATGNPQNPLSVVGNVAASGTIQGGVGAPDLAENIAVSESVIEGGHVVIADPAGGESVVRSRRAHETSVLGVISTKPGMLINAQRADVEGGHARDPRQRPLALAGRVPVKVTLEGGAIRPGDLLATSSTPGHAMRAVEPWRGGIIGTALEAFHGQNVAGASKAGKVIVFLNLQPAPAFSPEAIDRLTVLERSSRELMAENRSLRDRLEAVEKRLVARRSDLEARLVALETRRPYSPTRGRR